MTNKKMNACISHQQISANKLYEKASAELVYFNNSDVVTASGGGGGGGGSSVTCFSSVFGVGCNNGW